MHHSASQRQTATASHGWVVQRGRTMCLRSWRNIAATTMDMAIEIRAAKPDDSAAIQEVHARAFRGPVEAKLVQLISERKKALITLVAVSDGRVVGHILFSRVTIANSPDTFNAVGLAPVGVLPEFQRKGIGSALIREGLERCKQAGYHAWS